MTTILGSGSHARHRCAADIEMEFPITDRLRRRLIFGHYTYVPSLRSEIGCPRAISRTLNAYEDPSGRELMSKPKQQEWSRAEVRLLRHHYALNGARKVAELTGRSLQSIYYKAKELKLRAKTRSWNQWTTAQKEQLVRLYSTTPNAELARKLGHPAQGVQHMAVQMGLRKDLDQFNPNMHRRMPIGHEIINSKGTVLRKISDTRNAKRDYRPVHWIVWENANGPIPPKHTFIFIDGNKTNTSLDNLLLLTRRDKGMRFLSKYHAYPLELKQAINALNHLKKAISEAS